MTEIPVFTIIIVTLAATLYCATAVGRLVKRATHWYVANGFKRIAKLHHDTYREIQTDFDFWWNGEPVKVITESMRNRVVLPGAPEELQEMARQPFVEKCRESALHLAVHARMTAAERQMITKLPKLYGLREQMVENHDDHEESLNEERTLLLELGLNTEELEKHFAPAV